MTAQQKIIIITGVESTGKSTLTTALANHFAAPMIAETARQYITEIQHDYNYEDLEKIAEAHWQEIEKGREIANEFLFVDTAFIVLKIWSEERFGKCCPFILNTLASFQPDAYLLCDIDLPWVYDAQREHPNDNDRIRLHKNYISHLQEQSKPFIVLSGIKKERLEKAARFLENL